MKLVPIVEINQGNTSFGLPERQGLSARIKNPVLHVRYWMDQGAKSVFLKDKDGINIGKPQFSKQLEYLDGNMNGTLYYCGGIRDLRSVRIFEQRKYSRIVSATSLIENKKFLRNIVANDIGSIALWVDSIDGFVYTRNATHPIGKRTMDLLRSLPEYGINEIFFCSHSNGVVNSHPDIDTIEHILDLGIEKLYVADNVSTRKDLQLLGEYQKYGLAGVAIHKALYDGTFSVAELKSIFQYETIDL